jgi:hypothetical protein
MGMGMGGPAYHGSVASAAGSAPSTPSVNGGASSLGPSVNGGAASGPSVGAGGSASGPSAGQGGAVTVPSLGSSGTARPHLTSCADVAAYAQSLGTPDQCLACLETQCCNELLGCFNSADCLNYADCAASNCNGGLSGNCSCDGQFPGGMAVYDHYAQCAIGPCRSACVTVTVSGGGPGGGNPGGGSPGGGSCASSGSQCAQNSDCCSGTCTTAQTMAGPVSFCQ